MGSGGVPRGEKMLYSETYPESYIDRILRLGTRSTVQRVLGSSVEGVGWNVQSWSQPHSACGIIFSTYKYVYVFREERGLEDAQLVAPRLYRGASLIRNSPPPLGPP